MTDPITTKLESGGFQPAGGRFAGYTPQGYLRRIIAESEDWPADELALMQRAICGLEERDTWMPVITELHRMLWPDDDVERDPERDIAARVRQLQAQVARLETEHDGADIIAQIQRTLLGSTEDNTL